MKFYPDTCIYLNMWFDETDAAGRVLGAEALAFFMMHDDATFFFSGFILKELGKVLSEEEFSRKRSFFDRKQFRKVLASEKEYDEARRLQSAGKSKLSFSDCMHAVLASSAGAVLVTRDKELLEIAKKHYVAVARPEELI